MGRTQKHTVGQIVNLQGQVGIVPKFSPLSSSGFFYLDDERQK